MMAKKLKQHKPLDEKEVEFNFEFGIVRVANQGFFVNESIEIKEPFDIAYTLRIGFNTEMNHINFIVGAVYKNQDDDQHFLTSSALTQFFVKDLNRYLNNESPRTITVPDELMYMLFSISFTHARAIQSVNVASTKFSSFVLPIINPAEIYNSIMKDLGMTRSKIN